MTTTYGTGTGPRAQQARREQTEREHLANVLANWAGRDAEEAHRADIAERPDARHYTYCCGSAYEDGARNEYAFAMELPLDHLRHRHTAARAEREARGSHVALATECGSDGPYRIGVEYVERDGICRLVRRHVRREVFLGYGRRADGTGVAVTAVSFDGPLTEWRVSRCGADELVPAKMPASPPFLGLPDAEHGCTWDDPIDIPSSTHVWYHFDGREVSQSEAVALIEGEIPPLRPGWEERAVERARREGVLPPAATK